MNIEQPDFAKLAEELEKQIAEVEMDGSLLIACILSTDEARVCVSALRLAAQAQAGAKEDIPLCAGHADAWFCGRNHLHGGLEATCVVCAFESQEANMETSSLVDGEDGKVTQTVDGHTDHVPTQRSQSVPALAGLDAGFQTAVTAHGSVMATPDAPAKAALDVPTKETIERHARWLEEWAEIDLARETRDGLEPRVLEKSLGYIAARELRRLYAALERGRHNAEVLAKANAASTQELGECVYKERTRADYAESRLTQERERADYAWQNTRTIDKARMDAEQRCKTIAAETWEKAAKVCEKRAENRFAEHGIREGGTGATYYRGSQVEFYEAQDEEDEACAVALRAEAKKESKHV